jgi:mannose-6-phosphate isomerase
LLGNPDLTLADVATADEVPLLVKLLAADQPLSIQVHPPEPVAEAMFAAGSPLVSDDRAKIELLIALEPFSVFAGWRDSQDAVALLRSADCHQAADLLADGDLHGAIRLLLAMTADEVAARTPAVLAAVATRRYEGQTHAYTLAAQSFPGDAGLLVLLLLDHHLLAAGAGVYMPAGGVHAYAQGFGLEVMTSSDNVLRLGLTSKTVAVEEAIAALDDAGDPRFVGADVRMNRGQPTVTSYYPHAAPFTARLLQRSEASASGGHYRCVLAIGGTTTITADHETVTLQPGHAAAVLASEPAITIHTDGAAAVIEANPQQTRTGA